ncbi:hypothetical protein JZ751_009313 [Albula glossodonta]|uniref:Inactive dipeptidyl peptidase 10 n=1 Tax=Albula glossodonta TaxID=121402 RepID=A0A8T2NBY9_9TELE|nr:hypothetical protein JZ751_009313 [Albula glossodonta]
MCACVHMCVCCSAFTWSHVSLFEQDLGGSGGPPRNWKGIGIAMVVILGVLSLVILSVILLTPDETRLSQLSPLTLEDLETEEFKVHDPCVTWLNGEARTPEIREPPHIKRRKGSSHAAKPPLPPEAGLLHVASNRLWKDGAALTQRDLCGSSLCSSTSLACQREEISQHRVAQISLHRVAQISLHRVAQISLHRVAQISLHRDLKAVKFQVSADQKYILLAYDIRPSWSSARTAEPRSQEVGGREREAHSQTKAREPPATLLQSGAQPAKRGPITGKTCREFNSQTRGGRRRKEGEVEMRKLDEFDDGRSCGEQNSGWFF